MTSKFDRNRINEASAAPETWMQPGHVIWHERIGTFQRMLVSTLSGVVETKGMALPLFKNSKPLVP